MIRDQLISALRTGLEVLGVSPVPDTIEIERPARREHGDWSSNVALSTAKRAGRNPRELAAELVTKLEEARLPHVEKIEIAGPGFVNFHLADTHLYELVREVVAQRRDFASSDVGSGTHINVEFVSANPTGPLHAGHARGAVVGDNIANLLEKTGHEVTREFYVNDRGVQMQYFADSLRARKAGQEPPEDGYHGQYIIDWATHLPDDVDALEWGYAHAKADQSEVLGRLGVEFERWSSERRIVDSGKVTDALDRLDASGHTFTEEGAKWLRTTEFGDDKDRVLVKSDGSYTYLTPDIGYHDDKFDRADQLINIWGADHHGYINRMKAAMSFLGHDPDDLEIIVTQLVKLVRNGEEVQLSKRTGDIIELRDIIDEIGPDATRFTYSLQSVDSRQTFDLALAASQGMDNPVYYVQMAHARLCGVQRNAAEAGIELQPVASVDLTQLTHERELELLRQLSELPDIVQIAAADRAPHRITTWLRDFAGSVHGFYHDCYVVGDGISPELTQARLALCDAAKVGLQVGLDLIGVTAPESM
ncbi:MAG: arginine--tRNA ligase [Acidimicrobiales bacterium]|nr:arginine--tRNA ligase [Acidimicrobiales bacterium]